jgi:hypothetical protein
LAHGYNNKDKKEEYQNPLLLNMMIHILSLRTTFFLAATNDDG